LRQVNTVIVVFQSSLIVPQEELYKHIKYYADGAPPDQAARYAAAADSFRMPYWDWARGENVGTVPDFFTTQMINVVHTNGFNETIWNPLYSFYFHPLTPEGFNDKVTTVHTSTYQILTIHTVGPHKLHAPLANLRRPQRRVQPS
jgi:hypothetical protein